MAFDLNKFQKVLFDEAKLSFDYDNTSSQYAFVLSKFLEATSNGKSEDEAYVWSASKYVVYRTTRGSLHNKSANEKLKEMGENTPTYMIVVSK